MDVGGLPAAAVVEEDAVLAVVRGGQFLHGSGRGGERGLALADVGACKVTLSHVQRVGVVRPAPVLRIRRDVPGLPAGRRHLEVRHRPGGLGARRGEEADRHRGEREERAATASCDGFRERHRDLPSLVRARNASTALTTRKCGRTYGGRRELREGHAVTALAQQARRQPVGPLELARQVALIGETGVEGGAREWDAVLDRPPGTLEPAEAIDVLTARATRTWAAAEVGSVAVTEFRTGEGDALLGAWQETPRQGQDVPPLGRGCGARRGDRDRADRQSLVRAVDPLSRRS